ncbi:uncharacterized protein RSE6_04128 [Rhynchosporium secalis]|uniref:Integrase catalytic domain-containing protein n=1 Tax=Rhynchosporium secalis TaxID=38038 RepID=A0A1E1M4I1_RHYSE|nr:uncharacterized protein RSE6_04128 [Rhynchosporium secalis]
MSWHHPIEERQKAKERFKSQNASKFNAFTYPINSSETAPEEASSEIEAMINTRYSSGVFYGIIIDTRAAAVSTVGRGQYEAYKALYKAELLPSRGISIKFGVGNASSIGALLVPTLIGNITFEVMTTDTPFLLCLADIDKLEVMLDNLRNVLVTLKGDIPIKLTKLYKHYQEHGKSPSRFKFKLKDNVDFNFTIIVDILQLEGRQMLHIVDEATTFQNRGFLKDISVEHLWINTYLGPPDFIVTDAGTQFKAREFIQSAKVKGSIVKTIPVEAHHSIGKVERYYAPLKRAYTIIRKELLHLDCEIALQMAFYAINCIAGPGGIVPVLLVFGAYLRMVKMDTPSPTVAACAAALHKATKEIQKLRSTR